MKELPQTKNSNSSNMNFSSNMSKKCWMKCWTGYNRNIFLTFDILGKYPEKVVLFSVIWKINWKI